MGSSLMSMLAVSTALAASLSTGSSNSVEPPQLESQEYQQDAQSASKSDDTVEQILRQIASKENTPDSEVTGVSRVMRVLDSPGSVSSSSINSTNPLGIDISGHQHNSSGSIDINTAVDQSNIEFAFIKATESTNYVNPNFREDATTSINNGIPIGFYHYAKPKNSISDAKSQAKFFVDVTGINKGVKTLPPILDLEENKEGLTTEQLIAWTQAYVDEIKTLTGKNVMMYTYPSFWRKEMGNTTRFSELPLWIAHYHDGNKPDVPGGWTNWTFWQYTSKGKVNGYNQDIDMNFFNGSSEALKSIYS